MSRFNAYQPTRMRFFACTIVLLILLITSSAMALTVTFIPKAEIDGLEITLGDIATFSEKTELSMALASQTVTQSPAPGQKTVLQSQAIIKHFATRFRLDNQINWRGAALIEVHRTGMLITTSQILGFIDLYLAQRKEELPPAEYTFIPKAQPLPFSIPKGKLSWEVIPSNPSVLGSKSLSLIFRVDGRVRKNITVRGRLEAIANVVVAATNIARGSLLTNAHLTTAPTDINRLRDPFFTNNSAIGKKLTRSIKAGEPLRGSIVVTPPVINKGELVQIRFKRGQLQVTATGIARANGITGKTIRVQNSQSKKIIHCRVVGPGLVEVAI